MITSWHNDSGVKDINAHQDGKRYMLSEICYCLFLVKRIF